MVLRKKRDPPIHVALTPDRSRLRLRSIKTNFSDDPAETCDFALFDKCRTVNLTKRGLRGSDQEESKLKYFQSNTEILMTRFELQKTNRGSDVSRNGQSTMIESSKVEEVSLPMDTTRSLSTSMATRSLNSSYLHTDHEFIKLNSKENDTCFKTDQNIIFQSSDVYKSFKQTKMLPKTCTDSISDEVFCGDVQSNQLELYLKGGRRPVKQARSSKSPSTSRSEKEMRETSLIQQPQSEFKQIETNRVGLVNLANTCYLNSVMQCLLRCEHLLRELKSPIWLKRDSCFKKTVNDFFEVMSKAERNVAFSPKKLFDEICSWKQCSHYKSRKQQDAAELIRVFLDKLENDYKRAAHLFNGELQTRTCCSSCNTKVDRDEVFALLALNLENKPSNSRKSHGKRKAVTNIEELLKKFQKKRN